MNWLKDNLILVLGCLCLALGLGWIISNYRADAAYAELETKYTTTKVDFDNAAAANATNQVTLAELRAANEALIAKHKADEEAARLAVERLTKFNAALEAKLVASSIEREKLAQENADVRAYLDAGMPCELARQLWGHETGACSN